MKLQLLASIIGLAGMLAIGGCVTATPQELQAADYGPAPTQKMHDAIREFMALRLRDADSAKYQFPEEAQTAFLKAGPLSGKTSVAGWRVEVFINAKNGFGGYTGFKHYSFLIYKDRVIAFNELADMNMNTWQVVK